MQSREYRIWKLMRGRCNNRNHPNYHRYGGRGIRVCSRWDSFAMFLRDMGPAPSSRHTLDRFPNNDGNYEPGNCRWATRKEQSRNTSQNRLIEWGGETFCLSEWAERLGVGFHCLFVRLKRYPLEKAMRPGRINRGSVGVVDGKESRLVDLARDRGVNINTFRKRLGKGWTVEQALALPLEEYSRAKGADNRPANDAYADAVLDQHGVGTR